MIGAT